MFRWSSFGTKHLRFLQQAQQLANMGDFADRYAAIGKNRLLLLDHLRKESGLSSCYELFEENPIPNDGIAIAELPEDRIKELYNYETTDDPKGEKLKIHLDAFITLKRFRKKGIEDTCQSPTAPRRGGEKLPGPSPWRRLPRRAPAMRRVNSGRFSSNCAVQKWHFVWPQPGKPSVA